MAIRKLYRRNQEICGQEQPARNFYGVLSGTVRQCIARADGRRQIVDLLLPEDFFGLTGREEHDYSAEAAGSDTVVLVYPRQRIEALAADDPQIASALRQILCATVARLQSQLLTIGRITAREKVGAFLLDLASRLSDGTAHKVELPVSRYDIADYLAISVETVSRSLTELKQRGAIALPGTRRVKIINRDALENGSLGYRHAA